MELNLACSQGCTPKQWIIDSSWFRIREALDMPQATEFHTPTQIFRRNEPSQLVSALEDQEMPLERQLSLPCLIKGEH